MSVQAFRAACKSSSSSSIFPIFDYDYEDEDDLLASKLRHFGFSAVGAQSL